MSRMREEKVVEGGAAAAKAEMLKKGASAAPLARPSTKELLAAPLRRCSTTMAAEVVGTYIKTEKVTKVALVALAVAGPERVVALLPAERVRRTSRLAGEAPCAALLSLSTTKKSVSPALR